MHNNKRRQNGMNGGNGGQNRHNNRPRRFGGGRNGGDDSANVARTRRNAMQSREKYNNMARDAMASGDRVQAEYYLQHADHYYRILLSLPQEEVRQPYPQQHAFTEEGAVPENVQGNGNYADNGSAAPESPASALPSFITQPVPQENLQD